MFESLFGRFGSTFGWFASTRRKRKPRSRNYRPWVDVLEERRVLAGYFNVTGSSLVQEPLTTSETKYVEFSISLSPMGGMPLTSGSVTWTASSQTGDTATPNVDYQALSGNVTPSYSSGRLLRREIHRVIPGV